MTQTANIPAADTGKIDRLFNLLPMSYRQRDLEEGSPLQMLLRVIAEQVNLVENDIFQLYDNWFIETCQDWVVPYIADLLGYQPVNPPDPTVTPSAALERVLVPRSEVANTIRFRRRKGTLSLLPDLAVAVSGWPAIVQEFDGKVGVTQALDHLHLSKGRFAELHDPAPLDLVSPSASAAAFDPLSHSVDIREIDSLLSHHSSRWSPDQPPAHLFGHAFARIFRGRGRGPVLHLQHSGQQPACLYKLPAAPRTRRNKSAVSGALAAQRFAT